MSRILNRTWILNQWIKSTFEIAWVDFNMLLTFHEMRISCLSLPTIALNFHWRHYVLIGANLCFWWLLIGIWVVIVRDFLVKLNTCDFVKQALIDFAFVKVKPITQLLQVVMPNLELVDKNGALNLTLIANSIALLSHNSLIINHIPLEVIDWLPPPFVQQDSWE